MKEFLLSKKLGIKSINNYIYWNSKYLKWKRENMIDNHEKGILGYKEYCMKNYSIQTQKVIVSSLKHYIEYLNISVTLEMPRSKNTIKGTWINEKQYKEIMDNLFWENNFVSIRNREIIKVLWSTGLRVSEVLNLKWEHLKNGYIHIESKNNIFRYVPYKYDLFNEMKNISNIKSKYIFHTTTFNQMSYSSIYVLFKDFPNVSPHTMRHSFATRLIKKGISIFYIKELLGHQDINTTLLYLHLDREDLIKELKEKEWSV